MSDTLGLQRMRYAPNSAAAQTTAPRRSFRCSGWLSPGYTLVELVIATSVAGILALSAMAASTLLYKDYELTRFNQRLSDWVLNVEGLFLVRSDYQNLNLQAVVNAGLLDEEDMDFDTRTTPPTVTAVRHVYGGTLDIGVPTHLPSQYWAFHLTGLPAGARCLALLQHAVNVGSVVAVVDDNPATALAHWKDAVNYDKVNDIVSNFPAGYQIVRQIDGTLLAVQDMVSFCDTPGMYHMALAVLRRKM